MNQSSFAHLHSHTEFSLLDGSNRIRDYLDRVKELEMESAAITDHGVMYGVVDCSKYAKEIGIHPVIGCEVYVAPRGMTDKSSADRYHHLVLLAENNTGYKNLCRLVSEGFKTGFYYRPRIDFELLSLYSEGLIALSGCLAGEIPKLLAQGNYKAACCAASKYAELLGTDHYYLELQDHGIPEQKDVNRQLIRMGKELGIPLVVTNDVHYTRKEDAEAHDVLLCIQTKKLVSDQNRMRYEGGQYYVKSAEEMQALFPEEQEALENTGRIAKRCQVDFTFNDYHLPKFTPPDGLSSWEYLNRLCESGMREKYNAPYEKQQKQLAYELNTIKDMGFIDYFLIVWDFIHYAKSNGIPVGPGRGSAAGSLVSYCLGITEIDPLKYDLLFERFLNPQRVTMPDIDIDFCYERRHEVIDYVIEKYGRDNVAQIVTFGTLAARGVIRDVGRALGTSPAAIARITKLLPDDPKITIDSALSSVDELKKLYECDPAIQKLLDTAKKLEGLPRHTSTHAAGVVICPEQVTEYVPVCASSDGNISTQYVMTTLEELGLLKMDFLGLRTLTVIQKAIKEAEKNYGKKITFDYEDGNVFQYIGTGQTDGIFQLESMGMRNFMKQLKPKRLEDLIAGISLYRPGPMDFIPSYLKNREKPEQITYEIPQLAEILKPTYGCIIYQEQVMQIVRTLAGYDYGRADLVRRAMSKKKASVMEKERQFFLYGGDGIPGCEQNGIPVEAANRVFDQMIDFAKYAFNKSHAATYAVVAFQTAYMKYYYPAEYLAALMTSYRSNSEKTAEYLLLSRQMEIPIRKPDITESGIDFTVKDGSIVYALASIRDVGEGCVADIIKERQKKPYGSFKDFLTRMQTKGSLNKSAVESLIKAGAFDGMGHTRKYLMEHYPEIMSQLQYDKKNGMLGQSSLSALFAQNTQPEREEEYPASQLLAYEKEVLGIYLSGHPLDEHYEQWIAGITAKTSDFFIREEGTVLAEGETAVIGGMIRTVNMRTTRKKKQMASLVLEDLIGSVEVIIFPEQFEKYRSFLTEGAMVFCRGKVKKEETKNATLLMDSVSLFATEDQSHNLWLQFKDFTDYQEKADRIRSIEQKYPGRSQLCFYLKNTKQMKQSNRKIISCEKECLDELIAVCGQDRKSVV